MAYISPTIREQIARRTKGLCEYCQTPQNIVIEMQIDHIVPESADGLTHLNNLCLACISCNQGKGDHQSGLDPEINQTFPLFNPRLEQWSEHFRWDDSGTIFDWAKQYRTRHN